MKQVLFYLLIVAIMVGCTSLQNDKPLGSVENPVKLFFTPSVESETIAENSQDMVKFLEKETGLFFKTSIPTNYITVVESFGSDRADVAIMNSYGYLLANNKYKVSAELRIIRNNESTYQGQIIAHINSGIEKIEDVKGKRFAFTDPSSTSGYLLPLKMLKEKNITISNSVFGMKHDNVVTMIYQGQVDAGATYYSPPGLNGEIKDARSRVLTQFPDVGEKIKIIALTEAIPNDPLVFRNGINLETKEKIKTALLKYIQTDNGKKVFKAIYGIDGLVTTKDEDYNSLREMVKEMNIDINSTLN